GLSDRRVRDLCSQGKVEGAIREGRLWTIPQDTPKPVDGRYKRVESLLPLIDEQIARLATLRPLTRGEIERLNEEFTVEVTYNSNAIEGKTLTLR
ncbi:cell filamentation protein Fic, partial [Streptococcus suis]